MIQQPCPRTALPGRFRTCAFKLGRYQVTVGQYARFIGDGGYRDQAHWTASGFGRWTAPEQWELQFRFPSCPAVGVTWFEVSAYCRWRGERFRLPHEFAGTGPREVNWVGSSRGATHSGQPAAQLCQTPIGRVAPDRRVPPGATPEGLMDMAGNAFEWCSNAFDPRGSADTPRVVRGGCYRSVALFVRSAFRGRYAPDTRADFIGFRLCLTDDRDACSGPRTSFDRAARSQPLFGE